VFLELVLLPSGPISVIKTGGKENGGKTKRGEKMANNAAEHPPGNSVAEPSQEGDFGISTMDLRNLMELRSGEAVASIRDGYGDVQGICRRLKTSPIEGKMQHAKWPRTVRLNMK